MPGKASDEAGIDSEITDSFISCTEIALDNE
jgi:hypothetical protein